jgi:hypothetical protein
MKTLLKIIFTLLLILASQFADACPLCQPGAGGGGSVSAYQGTTIFLALLPFAFLTGIYFWMRNKWRNSGEEN